MGIVECGIAVSRMEQELWGVLGEDRHDADEKVMAVDSMAE